MPAAVSRLRWEFRMPLGLCSKGLHGSNLNPSAIAACWHGRAAGHVCKDTDAPQNGRNFRCAGEPMGPAVRHEPARSVGNHDDLVEAQVLVLDRVVVMAPARACKPRRHDEEGCSSVNPSRTRVALVKSVCVIRSSRRSGSWSRAQPARYVETKPVVQDRKLFRRRQHPIDRLPPDSLRSVHRKVVGVAYLVPAFEADQRGQRDQ